MQHKAYVSLTEKRDNRRSPDGEGKPNPSGDNHEPPPLPFFEFRSQDRSAPECLPSLAALAGSSANFFRARWVNTPPSQGWSEQSERVLQDIGAAHGLRIRPPRRRPVTRQPLKSNHIMTDIATHHFSYLAAPTLIDARITALRDAIAAYRQSRETYRQQREVYLRTLRELRSYKPWEMHDLRIDPADFEAVARQQAGW